MKRENRYVVLKVSDIEQAISRGMVSHDVIDALDTLAQAVKSVRKQRGRDELSCVVVESDWPEYEVVWGMIEARVSGEIQ